MAIPYVPTTHSDGQSWTAAKANLLEQAAADAHAMPCVRLRHTAAQATVSATALNLTFDTELYDTHGMHSGVNPTRITAQHAGVYDIGGCVEWSANPVDASLILFVNGTTVIAYNQVVADYRRQIVTAHYKLAVNDYVELRVVQVSGSGKNVNASSPYSPAFWAARIGTG